MFNGVRVGVDFDFGLGEACFTFVGHDHFHEGFFRMRDREYPTTLMGSGFMLSMEGALSEMNFAGMSTVGLSMKE